MKKKDVVAGRYYAAKVSGKVVIIELVAEHPNGGWIAQNTETNRKVRVKTAARLRYEAKTY